MNPKIKTLILCASFGFVVLGILVHFFPHSSLDIYLSHQIQSEVNEERGIDLSRPLTYVSVFGNGIFSALSVLIFSLLLLIAKCRRESICVLFVFLSDTLNLLVKMMINRQRPTSDVVHVAAKFNHSSFPSGHVVHYVVLFGFLLFVIFYKHLFIIPVRYITGIFLAFLILVIPISRVYLGAHWATDVIGGYLMGFVLLSMLLSFYLSKEK